MASRAVEVETRPNARRIVAMSTAFTIHVVGYALLAMPVSTPVELRAKPADPPMVWVETPEKPKPVAAKPIEREVAKPKPAVRPRVERVPVTPVFEDVALPELAIDMPVVEMPVDVGAAVDVSTIGDATVDDGALTILHGPHPRYPTAAIRKRLEGEVLLKVLVDERGRAADVAVLESSGHPALDRAARDAVKKWRFKAAVRDGVPVRAYGTVPVVFSLSQG